MPRQVRATRTLLIIVAIGHAVAIVALLALRDQLIMALRVTQPELTAADLSTLANVELVRTASFHLLLVVICGLYAAKIGSGSRRVLRIIVASQVLSVIFGVVTLSTTPDASRYITLPFIAIAIAILTLVLGSTQSRAFFTARATKQAK